jgi:hypothetical protein
LVTDHVHYALLCTECGRRTPGIAGA